MMTRNTAEILTTVGAIVFVTFSPLLIIAFRIVWGYWPL